MLLLLGLTEILLLMSYNTYVGITGAVLNRIFIFVVSSPSIYDRC